MLLRPRQKEFVERSVSALHEHGETLGIAPTGAGKTIMLSAVAGEMHKPGHKALIVAHRDELTSQNREKFTRVNPGLKTGLFNADEKTWAGDATFGMVQTLGRNLDRIPALDLLVIDEAHHTAAPTYRNIIDAARERNPSLKLFGVTATPNRGDKKGLRYWFSNVADQINIAELIASGHLVRPKTFVIDVGAQEGLKKVRKLPGDFDMREVEALMNTKAINDRVVDEWRARAGNRQTVIFCSTVAHAEDVKQAFIDAGVDASIVHGDLDIDERRNRLAAYGAGQIQVLVNVAVLTEGWDDPPTSCVVLLRPSSYKSTMIQMIGRGLRTVDPDEHPGVTKSDCIILDFGTACLMHGTLEQDVRLDGAPPGEAPTKCCPDCDAIVPIHVMECPFCGYIWEVKPREGAEREALKNFAMSEVDMLAKSPFRWEPIWDGAGMMASGMRAWAGVFEVGGGYWSIGGVERGPARVLMRGERAQCLAAADDHMNSHESGEAAHKSRRWLNAAATAAQLKWLDPASRHDHSLSRYRASCLLAYRFNEAKIQSAIMGARRAA